MKSLFLPHFKPIWRSILVFFSVISSSPVLFFLVQSSRTKKPSDSSDKANCTKFQPYPSVPRVSPLSLSFRTKSVRKSVYVSLSPSFIVRCSNRTVPSLNPLGTVQNFNLFLSGNSNFKF